MLFGRFFDRAARQRRARVDSLYEAVVAEARDPWLYGEANVPDTFGGRFEMMVWHLAFVVRRLRGAGGEAKDFSQELFDRFLDDMDRSMREAGVGDIAVPKRLKKMVRVWFGIIRALDDLNSDPPPAEALRPILAGNLYPEGDAPPLDALARRFAERARAVHASDPADLLAGRSPFAHTGARAA